MNGGERRGVRGQTSYPVEFALTDGRRWIAPLRALVPNASSPSFLGGLLFGCHAMPWASDGLNRALHARMAA
jgi:hypothetical protein